MKTPVRPRYLPPPYQDAAESGRLILRDGTTAQIHLALGRKIVTPCGHSSSGCRPNRGAAASSPWRPRAPSSVKTLCDASNPRSALTLLVTRAHNSASRIVATGSYLAKDESTAEVAFAVDDGLHGKGLGTLLLERLALLAVRHGFTRFWAVTHTDNRAMRDVFQESGFPVEERQEGGEIEVDLAVVPNETSVARLEMRDRVATAASLRPFFQPKAVAVVGASRDPASIGYRILEALVLNRFQGPVYPINPKASVVGCFRAYPSVRDLPEPVDLAVVAVPRDAVLGVVDDSPPAECAPGGHQRRLRGGQRRGSRAPEKTGGQGAGPWHAGDRPQLHGVAQHRPERAPGRIVFAGVPSRGQGGHVVAERSARASPSWRRRNRFGLGLSTFVSVGNKADVSGNDLLQYWEEDAGTNVILLYLESFGNPRRFARIAAPRQSSASRSSRSRAAHESRRPGREVAHRCTGRRRSPSTPCSSRRE